MSFKYLIASALLGRYNFGSMAEASLRWKAAVAAHADFVSSDQYEALAKAIR